jgi:hypothetical protein
MSSDSSRLSTDSDFGTDSDDDLHANVAEKLSPEMVELALKFVDQKHPLQKVSLFKVFPRLNHFGSYLRCLRTEQENRWIDNNKSEVRREFN